MELADINHSEGFVAELGITVEEGTPERGVMLMPCNATTMQPFGVVHGGATIALLESVASMCAYLRSDYPSEQGFGTHIDVRHVHPAREGMLRGVAELASEEDLGERGSKQIWKVEACQDDTLISTGSITTRIVPAGYAG